MNIVRYILEEINQLPFLRENEQLFVDRIKRDALAAKEETWVQFARDIRKQGGANRTPRPRTK